MGTNLSSSIMPVAETSEKLKRPKLEIEIIRSWPLDINLTNKIVSFIPFSRRQAIFQSCKLLNQACFVDFWSSNVSIKDYLNYIETLSYNLNYDQNRIDAGSIIQGIFEFGNVNEIKLLCRYERFKFITDYLHLVPAKSFYEILKWALARMGINQPIFETVAEECCRNGIDEIFEFLVSHGLYQTFWLTQNKDYDGRSTSKAACLLYRAARSNNILIVRNILQYKVFTQKELSIALNEACMAEMAEADELEFNWPVRNRDNFDALALVKLLISKGADLNYRDSIYYPPLLSAFLKGNIQLIDYLLEEGANIHEKNGDDDILSMAIYSLSVEAVEKALQLGFSYEEKYLNLFLCEYQDDYKEKKEKIIQICNKLFEIGAKVDGDDEETTALLILTCEYEMLEVIKLFSANGANYNRYVEPEEANGNIQYDEISPIYAAIYSKNLEIVKYLVRNLKVRIENLNEKWPSPVLYAVETVKSREITRFLLEVGASANQKDMIKIKEFLERNE